MNPSSPPPPLDADDRRWAVLLDAEAAGEPLSAADQAFLRGHHPRDPGLKAERALHLGLPHWGATPLATEDDDAVLRGTVEALLSGGAGGAAGGDGASTPDRVAAFGDARKPGRRRWPLVAGGLLAAAAAVLLLWRSAVPRPPAAAPEIAHNRAQGSTPGPARAPAAADKGESSAAAGPAPSWGSLRVLSGTWEAADAEDDSPTVVLTAATSGCLGHPSGSRLCAEPGTRLRSARHRADADADADADVEWLEGAGEVTLAARPEVVVLELRVAGVRVSAEQANVRVDVTRQGRWSLEVAEGAVVVETKTSRRTVSRGQRVDHQDAATDEPNPEADAKPGRRAAAPAASVLLRDARAARARGVMAEAATLYRTLVRAHPRSPLVGPAWVALGQVELARGHGKAAQAAFERYLARGGPLAEEAAYGRIQALRRRGRAKQEQEAIEGFLARYPGSSYAAALRQ